MDMAKPKIRFKGYTDEWEQRKLDNWGSFYYGRSCPKWSVTEDATIPCIRYGELYTKFGAKIDKVYSYTNMSPENLRLSKGTEVLIPRVGEDPMDYNHCTWLSMPNVAIGEMISVFNTDNNPLFTATMFNATLQNEFAMRVEGGSVTNLYFEKLKNIEVLFPSIAEQERIAAYFERLDNLITLHQRKCEQAKKLKKYMLQKMFPQNGQKVPEIRFKGFTDDWEQRKLGDVIDDMYNGQTPSRNKSEYWNGTIKWLSSGELNRGTVYDSIETITEEGQKAANLKIVPKGTFVMAITGLEAAGTRGNCALLGFDTTLNQSCMALFPKQEMLTSEFLFQWYRKVGEEYGINYTQGTKQQSYNAELIKILPISLPSVVEQRKISSYLSQLDHLITLHQQKCDELKNIKKFMLQNMFI